MRLHGYMAAWQGCTVAWVDVYSLYVHPVNRHSVHPGLLTMHCSSAACVPHAEIPTTQFAIPTILIGGLYGPSWQDYPRPIKKCSSICIGALCVPILICSHRYVLVLTD